MLQLNPQLLPPYYHITVSFRSIAYDFSNFRTPAKKYQNYVNFWVNNVNDNYLSSEIWKQTNK